MGEYNSDERHTKIATMFKEVFRTQGELSLHFVRSNKRNATLERTAVGRSNVVLRKLTQMYRGGQRKDEEEMEEQLMNKHKLSKWQQDVLEKRIQRTKALPKVRQIEIKSLDLDGGSLIDQANNAKSEENLQNDMEYTMRLHVKIDGARAEQHQLLWKKAHDILLSEPYRRSQTSTQMMDLARQFHDTLPPEMVENRNNTRASNVIGTVITRLKAYALDAHAREKRTERLKLLRYEPKEEDEPSGFHSARYPVPGEPKQSPRKPRWKRRASHMHMDLEKQEGGADSHGQWEPEQVAHFFREHVYGWGMQQDRIVQQMNISGDALNRYTAVDYQEIGFPKAMARQMTIEAKKLGMPAPAGKYDHHPLYGGPREEPTKSHVYGTFQSPRDRLLGLDRLLPDQQWEDLIRHGLMAGPGQRDIRIDPRLREKFTGQLPPVKKPLSPRK